jgi:hypothetical protein
MKPTVLFIAASAFALLFVSNLTTAKNVSTGIYAIVDQVTFEPEGDAPKFIRISGVFVIPVSLSSGNYRNPRRGYLYFQSASGTEQATRRDWNELKTFAGSGKVVGFGQYWVPNPNDPQGNPHHSLEVTVHANDDNPASPDIYPIPQTQGVIEVKGRNKNHYRDSDKIAAQLRHASHR